MVSQAEAPLACLMNERENGPLRVLFISLSGDVGGAERVMLDLVQGLDRRRFLPTVVVPADGLVADTARRVGAGVFVVPAPCWLPHTETDAAYHFRRYWEQLPSIVEPLLDVIERQKIDLVYSCTGGILHGAVAALLARRPHLQHLQDLFRHPDGLTLPFRSAAVTYRLLGSLASVAVCVGATVRKDVGGDIPDAKCRIVPLGFHLPPPDITPMPLPGSPNVMRVGIVGRVAPRKGAAVVLEIVRRVGMGSTGVRFYWLGTGAPHTIQRLRTDTEGDGKPPLHLLGFRDDVRPFMAAIDVLLHPSRIDAFPRVVIEAALAGRPTVATRCGGTEEIIEDGRTGLLAPIDDADALAHAVLRLAHNRSECREMGAAARESAARLHMTAFLDGMERALLEAHARGPLASAEWLTRVVRAGVSAPSRMTAALRRLGVAHLLRLARGHVPHHLRTR